MSADKPKPPPPGSCLTCGFVNCRCKPREHATAKIDRIVSGMPAPECPVCECGKPAGPYGVCAAHPACVGKEWSLSEPAKESGGREYELFYSGLAGTFSVRNNYSAYITHTKDSPDDEYIHVIEYSAFEQMKRELDELLDERRRCIHEDVHWNLCEEYKALTRRNAELERELSGRPADVANGWRKERDALRAGLAEAQKANAQCADDAFKMYAELNEARAEVVSLRHANANFHDARRELTAMRERAELAERNADFSVKALADVLAIRAEFVRKNSKRSNAQALATKYKTCVANIKLIVARKAWTHI